MMSKRREGLLHVTNVVLEGIYHEGMNHEAIFHKASPLLRRYFGCLMLVPVSVCMSHCTLVIRRVSPRVSCLP